jgi:hypothetical protein
MTYQVQSIHYNEDTGERSSSLSDNYYQTKKLAEYLAYKTEMYNYDDYVDVVISNNSVYIKPTKEEIDDRRDDEYYGSPTHALLGDAWLYRDCPECW